MVNPVYHILYIDSEESLRGRWDLPFKETPEFTIDIMTSAEDALNAQSTLPYDIIISEYQMAGMDGITLLKEVRARFGDLPFILFTTEEREEVVIEAINNGADFYLRRWGTPESQSVKLMQTIRMVVGRKRAEKKLLETRDRFKVFFASQQNGVIIIDPSDHRIIDVNPYLCNLVGLPEDRIIGKVCHTFLCPAELGKCPITDLDQRVDNAERVLLTNDGRRVPILKTVAQVMLGEKRYLIENILDLTEYKRVEEALREANRKVRILSGITRHDITNQLCALDAYCELLEEHLQDDPEGSKISHAIEECSTIIQKKIVFTRDYQELGMDVPAWQNLEKVSMMAAVDVLPDTTHLVIDTGQVEVFADPMLMMVFYNLFDNANRHGEQVSEIRITFTETGKKGILVIEDDGIGVPTDKKERIFEEGFGSNTGYGLFIIREILAITGLSLEETGIPGTGARFEITVQSEMWRRGTATLCSDSAGRGG